MHTINISDEVYRLLEERARAMRCAPDDLLNDIIQKAFSPSSDPAPVSPQNGQVSHRVYEEAQAKQNFAVFQQRLPELLKEHAGEYVAFRHGNIVGYGKDKKALWYEIREQYGPGSILVMEVTETPRVINLPFHSIHKVR
jgi:hypothetical protein